MKLLSILATPEENVLMKILRSNYKTVNTIKV